MVELILGKENKQGGGEKRDGKGRKEIAPIEWTDLATLLSFPL